MQQAIHTNAHVAVPSNQRFKKLRLLASVAGNVLGGAILLSGMLMLPQLFVSLLAN